MRQLQEDKLKYVNYILDVSNYCGIDITDLNPDELLDLSLQELDALSIEAEKTYDVCRRDKKLDQILDDIETFGNEYVKEYYGLNQKERKQ